MVVQAAVVWQHSEQGEQQCRRGNGKVVCEQLCMHAPFRACCDHVVMLCCSLSCICVVASEPCSWSS
jgi:hypothetical protein